MTSAPTRRPASGYGSPRQFCRRGAARPRRSPRCCPCSTCTGCPLVTSCPPSASSSARRPGCRAAVITRLTETWKAEQRAFAQRDLSQVDYVYLWADGIHVNIRLEEHKLCLLVMIGVRADGRKELVALADGYRESAESWADLLRDCARRGMRAPVLAVGDGALGSGTGCGKSSPRPGRAGAGSKDRQRARRAPEVCPPGGRRRRWRRSGAPRTRPRPWLR
jgi:Transposase, Mutator family